MPQSETAGHSVFAPSKASRWTVCTASVGFIEEHRHELDFSSSEAADEGTDAHSMACAMLEGKPVPQLKYDCPEMRRVVGEYVKFVQYLGEGCENTFEKKSKLFYRPADRGTVDVRIINRKEKILRIVDLKYGAGTPVYAKDNKQLATYAESVAQELGTPDDWLVHMVIYQPRDRNDDNAVRQWPIRRSELRTFCELGIEAPYAQIRAGNVQFIADPAGHCKFCEAKRICEAYRNYGLECLPDETRIISPAFPKVPEPKMLTRQQRIRVIAGRKALEEWLEVVEDYEVAQLLNGAEPIGFKLVEGKSNRGWIAPDKVRLILGEYLEPEQITPPSEVPLISVAEAEKLIGKNEFADLGRFIAKPPGKPTLVPESDKRPALTFGPSRDFDDLDRKPGSDFI